MPVKKGSGTDFKDIEKNIKAANRLLGKNKLDKALKIFKDIRDKAPKLAVTYIGIGNVYATKGNFKKARENYEKAISVAPTSEVYNNIGIICFTEGDKKKAEKYLKLAISLDETNLEAQKNLADIFLNERKYQEAIPLYEKILLKQQTSDMLISLSNCYFKLGHYKAAEFGYKKVLEFDPKNKTAKENLGLVAKKLK